MHPREPPARRLAIRQPISKQTFTKVGHGMVGLAEPTLLFRERYSFVEVEPNKPGKGRGFTKLVKKSPIILLAGGLRTTMKTKEGKGLEEASDIITSMCKGE